MTPVQNINMGLIIEAVRQRLASHVQSAQEPETFQLEPLQAELGQNGVQPQDVDKAYKFLVDNQDLLGNNFTSSTIEEKLSSIKNIFEQVISLRIGDENEINSALQTLYPSLMDNPIAVCNGVKAVESGTGDIDKAQILYNVIDGIQFDLRGKEEEAAQKLKNVLREYIDLTGPLNLDKKREVVDRIVRISNGILDDTSQTDLRSVLKACNLDGLDRNFRANTLEEELKKYPPINTESTLLGVLAKLRSDNPQPDILDKIDTLIIKMSNVDLNLAEFREVNKRLESHSKSPDVGIDQLIASFKTELMKRDVLSESAKIEKALTEAKSITEGHNIIRKFMKDTLGDKYDSLSKVDKQLLQWVFGEALYDAIKEVKAAPAKPKPDPAKPLALDIFTSTVGRDVDLVIPLLEGLSIVEENGKVVTATDDEGVKEVTVKLSEDKKKLIIDSHKATKDGSVWAKAKITKDGKTEDTFLKIQVKFEKESNKSVEKIPIIGMIASGVVGLLGIFGIRKSDDDYKSMSWGATILGLVGLAGFGYWQFKPNTKEQSVPQQATADKVPA